MARETAAARRAREAAESHAAFAKVKEEYPRRLMVLMANYANLPGFSFEVKQDDAEPLTFTFSVSDHLSFGGYPRDVPAEMTEWDHYYELESAERSVRAYHEHVAEDARKESVRRAAYAKLNKEERELLGL